MAALLSLVLVSATLPPSWPKPPDVTAAAFLLLDGETGQPLARHAAAERRPVASTVKLLTALTVLEHADPTETVTVGREVVGLEGASVGLEPGDRWSIEDLLEALLVRSGNDAAVALSVHVGGSVQGFVRLMRQQAAELGLEDVTLVSPSGLDDDNRLSAEDLAVITRAALDHPTIADLVAEETVALPTDPTAETRNELLGSYRGATGVKTGYTEASGWSVIASAERRGRSLIAVVLGSTGPDQRFVEAAALLDHGFAAFVAVDPGRRFTLRVAGGGIEVAAVAPPLLVPRDDPELDVALEVPVEVGELPEQVPVDWNGTELAEAPVTVGAVTRPPVEGAAAIARYLVDRGYAAMRAATRAGAWNR